MRVQNVILLAVLFLLLILAIQDVTAQNWSEEIYVCPGTNPDLYINPKNGELNIVSVIESKGVVYVRLDKSGNVLDSLIIPNTDKEAGMLKFGPTVAVDNLNNTHVGFRINKSSNKYDVFYTRQTDTGWSSPLKIGSSIERGYVVRMAIDASDRVHFAYGSVDPSWPNITGPVNYYILLDGEIQHQQHNIIQIRGDERFELDVSANGIVDLVTSDLHYPPDPPNGGPIYYWRSKAAGDSLTYRGDLHDTATKNGANGSSDVFTDKSGNTHVCYGAEKDNTISNKPSVRYCRLENGIQVLDSRITDYDEIIRTDKVSLGIGSVAANEDGEKVIIAYINTEDGPLYTRYSEDGGRNWQDAVYQASGWNSAESRNKHIIRAYRSDFYLVYPSNNGINLRYLKMTPNDPPVANLTTPDSAAEGSTIQFDASNSYDPDGSITSYKWDFQNDGVYDATTTTPLNSFKYLDDFHGEAKVKVIDNEGDSSSTTVPVKIFNLPPVAEAGGPYSGSWYTQIALTGNASDPGINDTLSCTWDLDADGTFETIGQNVLSPAYTVGDTHLVVFQVSDGDGGFDTDSALVIINNQPPVVGDIPDQSINEREIFSSINLDDYVNDPDNPDSTLTWEFSITTNLNLTLNSTNRVVTITLKEPTWEGSELITFTVTDPGGKSDSDAATFSVNAVNDPPVISSIPSQTRDENDPFTNIYLDNYVADPDDPDSTLSWTYFGAEFVTVSIAQRIVHVAVIDSEWAGIDTVGFIASDNAGLKDTATVIFKINPVNDPPVVIKLPNQEVFQNQEFFPINLDEYVSDPDCPDSLIVWTWAGNSKLVLKLSGERILTIQHPDTSWIGSETIIFWAKDPEGLYDLFTTKFVVKSGIVGVDEYKNEIIPNNFTLYPNYPNPFNPYTTIMYDIAKRAQVTLIIYNQLGHEVRTLVNQNHLPGSYRVTWDGKDNLGNKVTSGVYFYRFHAGGMIQTRKMILIY